MKTLCTVLTLAAALTLTSRFSAQDKEQGQPA
jgi:hypothetical protein